MADLSRRSLLRGQWRRSHAIRPPWSLAEPSFSEGCARCEACISACETGVLIIGEGGYPECDFQRAECTFCRRCVDACEVAVFNLQADTPWLQHATINQHCLAQRGVECRSCQDNCEPNAIRFRPRLGGISVPELDTDLCNGCGACVRGCPTQAISITGSEDGK